MDKFNRLLRVLSPASARRWLLILLAVNVGCKRDSDVSGTPGLIESEIVPCLSLGVHDPHDPDSATVKSDPLVPSLSGSAAPAAPNEIWEPGAVLNVYFHDGTPKARESVAEIVSLWLAHANLRMVFFPPDKRPQEVHIGVTFSGEGYESQIGTRSLERTRAHEPSLRLGGLESKLLEAYPEFRRVVLHEFGHALGLNHEHRHPKKPFEWVEDKVIAYFTDLAGWPEDQIRRQVMDRLNYGRDASFWGEFDGKSVMCYAFPPELTVGNAYTVRTNYELSDGDKRAMAMLYPGDGASNVNENFALGNTTEIAAMPRKGRSPTFRWTLRIDGSPAALEKVSVVKYILHSSYGSGRVRLSSNRESGFAISDVAWGNFVVVADVVLWDGRKLRIEHELDFCDAFRTRRGEKARRRMGGRGIRSKDAVEVSAACDTVPSKSE